MSQALLKINFIYICIFKLQIYRRKCDKSIERFLYPTPIFPWYKNFAPVVCLLQLLNQYRYIIIISSYLLPIFSVFTHCPFPVPGFHPAPTLHFGVVPVWPLVAMVCFLYLRTLIDSLWNTGLMFCRVNFNWCVSDVLLMISLGLKDFERRVTELKCHCHDVRSTVYAVRMIYHCWCWPGLPGLR